MSGVMLGLPTHVASATGKVVSPSYGGFSQGSKAPADSVQPLHVGLAALGIATCSRFRKTVRRAEPISAAAAAAAAAAAVKAGSAAVGAKAAAGAAAGKATALSTAAKAKMAAGTKAAVGTKATAAAKGARLAGTATSGAAGLSKAGKQDEQQEDANFEPSMQIGVTAPLGYFDPLGFVKRGQVSDFRNYRAAELKHGRVAMMASVGAVVQHYVKFPGFENMPSGMDAIEASPGTYGFTALFVVAGYLETIAWTEDSSKEPGDFGDPAGLGMYTDDMRLKELNNGRMAMFAAMGIIVADIITGRDAVEQLSAFLNPAEIVADVANPL